MGTIGIDDGIILTCMMGSIGNDILKSPSRAYEEINSEHGNEFVFEFEEYRYQIVAFVDVGDCVSVLFKFGNIGSDILIDPSGTYENKDTEHDFEFRLEFEEFELYAVVTVDKKEGE